MRWVGHAARIGEMRNAYKILVGKPEGKEPIRSDRSIILERIFGK
jgi:hypothetical protein